MTLQHEKKRIIFFLNDSFSLRDYHRFGFDIIQNRGFIVEAWQFPFLFNNAYRKEFYSFINKDFSNYKVFSNLLDLQNQVDLLTKFDFVIDLANIYTIFNLIKVDSLNAPKIGLISVGSQPAPQGQLNLNKISNFLKKFINSSYLVKKMILIIIKNKILYNKTKLPKISFIINGGYSSRINVKERFRARIDLSTIFINSHAFDYDRYIELENEKPDNIFLNKNYTVFLDEDIPTHPDYKFSGMNPPVQKDIYFKEINLFFKNYEKYSNSSVVIAAHPRSNYSQNNNPFDGREIIKNNTINLIKYADRVIFHTSTSINFAIIYNKPIISLKSKSYDGLLNDQINCMELHLGVPAIDVSEKYFEYINKINVDDKLYKKYFNTYIKEVGTEEVPIWDIFCNYVDSISK